MKGEVFYTIAATLYLVFMLALAAAQCADC